MKNFFLCNTIILERSSIVNIVNIENVKQPVEHEVWLRSSCSEMATLSYFHVEDVDHGTTSLSVTTYGPLGPPGDVNEQRGLKIVMNGDGEGSNRSSPLDESYIVEPYRNCSYKYPSPNQMEASLFEN
jgi:hypothetical protein